jgi:membrane-associated phospholipid phosphatase
VKTLIVVLFLIVVCFSQARADSYPPPQPPRPPEVKIALDAAATAAASAELLKLALRDPRPTGSGYGFPSGHTAVAFALAGVASQYHPKQKWLWYGLAVRIGWSRVKVDAHDWDDVIAGAALGGWIGDRAVNSGGILLRSWEW